MNKNQVKRPSIEEVLNISEVRKACKILLEERPEIYTNVIPEKLTKKKPILELSYEDSEDDEKQMQMINQKFHLHQDMTRHMRSERIIPTNLNSTI